MSWLLMASAVATVTAGGDGASVRERRVPGVGGGAVIRDSGTSQTAGLWDEGDSAGPVNGKASDVLSKEAIPARARRQAETVSIVSTAGVFAQASGTFTVDVAYTTAQAPGNVNVRCIMRAWFSDGRREKFFNDVVILLNGQTGTVTCSFTAANYVGTTDAWNNAMAMLW